MSQNPDKGMAILGNRHRCLYCTGLLSTESKKEKRDRGFRNREIRSPDESGNKASIQPVEGAQYGSRNAEKSYENKKTTYDSRTIFTAELPRDTPLNKPGCAPRDYVLGGCGCGPSSLNEEGYLSRSPRIAGDDRYLFIEYGVARAEEIMPFARHSPRVVALF